MKHEYTLIIDSREKENVRKALDGYGIQYTIQTLVTGDMEITTPTGTVTVERKQMTDFIQSMMSGRLENQMRRLSEKSIPGLLLTGSFAEYRKYAKSTNLTIDHVLGAVASCVVKYGLRFVVWIQSVENQPHATGVALTAKLIKKIAEGKLDAIPDRSIKKHIENPQRELVRMACGVPTNVAEELLKTFKSFRNIIDARDDELIVVKGMGKTRIARMRMLIDGKPQNEIQKGTKRT